jgi:hypothetical protein
MRKVNSTWEDAKKQRWDAKCKFPADVKGAKKRKKKARERGPAYQTRRYRLILHGPFHILDSFLCHALDPPKWFPRGRLLSVQLA